MLVYKKEVCPEPFTHGITHGIAKLLALVGYLWCTISTFVLKYSSAFTFLITCGPVLIVLLYNEQGIKQWP